MANKQNVGVPWIMCQQSNDLPPNVVRPPPQISHEQVMCCLNETYVLYLSPSIVSSKLAMVSTATTSSPKKTCLRYGRRTGLDGKTTFSAYSLCHLATARMRLLNSHQVGLADDNFNISLGSKLGTSQIIIGPLRILLTRSPCSSKTVDQFKTITWYSPLSDCTLIST
jgi:hypothetical protein